MKCPKKHLLKRHRRRNAKYQYYCSKCNIYLTEDSKIRRIKRDPTYYKLFITKYINSKLSGQNPSISKLCNECNISRASLYRHFKSLDTLNVMSLIQRWTKEVLGNLFTFDLNYQTIVLKRINSSHTLNITIVYQPEDKSFFVQVKSSEDLSRGWISTDNASISADGKCITAILRGTFFGNLRASFKSLEEALQ